MTNTPDFGTPEPVREPWMPPAAPKPGVIPLRALGLGEILGGAVATIRRHPGLLLGSTALVMLVSQALGVAVMLPVIEELQGLAASGVRPTPEEIVPLLLRIGIGGSLAVLLGVLGQVFLTGLATIVVSRAVVGKPVTLAEAWAELRPNLLRLLGVSLLFGLAVLVGTVLCVLPGIWVGVLFSFAMPAVVLERLTVGQAFQRSRTLVRDAWWSTFGILVAAFAIGWVVNLVFSLPFAGFGSVAAGDLEAFSTSQYLFSSGASFLSGVLTYPFISVVLALVYVDRRIITERLDVQLAQAAEQP
ncbi:hypothetical protein ACFFQW_12900 [Umezawaea endophytica]|uniref:DUF7847 domain-containing protein n=1 Tax=Umezawaea endophytica TaxID=1654476 RepID=A0A9X2VIJ5_9PSEU|nr:hypothetical protein [Umezawaea endophytica]MCS7477258.1 hypothetical protein [Umezawaea endophytica]